MRQILSNKYIRNSFLYYNKYFNNPFDENEKEIISKKLLEIIKEDDFIITKDGLKLPQFTLTIIYFICEYKKAYDLSSKEQQKERKNTHESLGEGNKKRRDKHDELIEITNNESNTEATIIIAALQAHYLQPLTENHTQKFGLLQLGLLHVYGIWIKRIYEPFFQQEYDGKTLIQLFDESMELFSFTYISKNKISNSLAILLFNVLVKSSLKVDETIAIKWIKDVIRELITHYPIPKDTFRPDNFTKREIYFAGLYNKMPIFQWYIPKVKTASKSYYALEDIKLIQNGKDDIDNDVMSEFFVNYAEGSVLKSLGQDNSESREKLRLSLDSPEAMYENITKLHEQYAMLPLGLFQHIIIRDFNYLEKRIAYFSRLYSKFTRLISKLTRK